MFSEAIKYRSWILNISFLIFLAFLTACQDASEPMAGKEEGSSVQDTPKALGTATKGGLGGECEGFDVMRTPVRTGLEAMPCAQSCPNTHEPVCTADGLTYPNACYAELAKAVIVSQGDCQ